ncbi:MAG: hypothetical protein KY468_21440, partial [Armatimonadetes bacterium]|nr:hypothetical protein [Armatimonadota bacterium]
MTSSDHWNRLRNRILLLALFAPLVVLPWAYDATELPKLTFLRLTALGLMLAGLFTVSRSAWASSQESRISEIHPLRLPIMLFLIVMGAAAFGSPDRWSSLAAFVDLAMLAFFAFAFTGAAKDAGFQARALRVMAGVGGGCAAWALVQALGFDPLNGDAFRHAGVPVGPFADPALLAGFLAAAFPLAAGLCAGEPGKLRPWGVACLLLIALALGFTRHPLPIFGAVAGAALTLLALRKIQGAWDRRRTGVLLLSGLLLLAGIAGGRTVPDGGARAVRAAAGIEMAKAQPVLGWGPGAYGLIAPRYAASEIGMIPEPNRAPAPGPGNLMLS